jgi:hypothetical protein
MIKTELHYVCSYIPVTLHNSSCGLYIDSQCMKIDWILKSEKVALMNCNETRNSCIYIRFCSLAVFVLWAHIIGHGGFATSLLQKMFVSTTAPVAACVKGTLRTDTSLTKLPILQALRSYATRTVCNLTRPTLPKKHISTIPCYCNELIPCVVIFRLINKSPTCQQAPIFFLLTFPHRTLIRDKKQGQVILNPSRGSVLILSVCKHY